ncbi:U8 snoRNA-decapping enzyme-like [Oppia nitens]|uniref:U8 snoRNA-decapping enzyme-like n=1 Tax=Oppia nitens TaxID=1686743 RepID=UPI0023DB6EA1|nr:U8 snoRNA-decapping enzyme-like [Oppia nitens]
MSVNNRDIQLVSQVNKSVGISSTGSSSTTSSSCSTSLWSAPTSKFRRIDLPEALANYSTGHIHAVHIIFWFREPTTGMAYALMQIRSDGQFGFPGGKCDEPVVDEQEMMSALYREIWEEMDYRLGDGDITIGDHLFSHVRTHDEAKVLHFFGKQLTAEQFRHLELTHSHAESFPSETVGIIRIPLGQSDIGECRAVRKFFAGFGRQKFAGNARNQLLESIVALKLISPEDIQYVISRIV